MKKRWLLIIIILLILFGISKIDFKTPENYYKEDNIIKLVNLNKKVLSNIASNINKNLNVVKKNNESKNKNTTNKIKNNDDIKDSTNKNKIKNNNKITNKVNNNNTDKINSNINNESLNKKNETIKVTIYIDVTKLLNKNKYDLLKPELKKYIPSNGYVLNKTTIEVKNNSTAFEVLQKITRLYRIHMEYKGTKSYGYDSIYVNGINHIYEFSAGSESGWMYSINGAFQNYGLNQKIMKDNDILRIVYTTNLGCDVGFSMKACQ
ncbi:MAG: DUF4430 domain-containing protein [Bacilli bacterium]|jgi:hypothetical protein|nr:DUF4430 domain-containing protein [Bacilli bacterium]